MILLAVAALMCLSAVAVGVSPDSATAMTLGLSPSSFVVVGNTRVTALSATLVRLEPRGPKGFENRSTFNVVGRDMFPGLPIVVKNTSAAGTWLSTSAYHVYIPASGASPSAQGCRPQTFTDASEPVRLQKYPEGLRVYDAAACCAACAAEPNCVAWVVEPMASERNCWPLSAAGGTRPHINRTFGWMGAGTLADATITTPQGRVLWNGVNTGDSARVAANLLHWPAPLDGIAYAFEDSPRFNVPAWGPTPIPPGAKVRCSKTHCALTP